MLQNFISAEALFQALLGKLTSLFQSPKLCLTGLTSKWRQTGEKEGGMDGKGELHKLMDFGSLLLTVLVFLVSSDGNC